MLLWPALLCCLLGGWAGAAGLARPRFLRALLALPAGLGLWLAWLFLLSFVLGPGPAGLGAAALTLGWGWLLGRRSAMAGPPPNWGWRWSAWVVLALSAAVAWLSLVGGFQLDPPRDFLVFELPAIAQLQGEGAGLQHPLGALAASGVTPFATAAAFAGDSLRSSLILGGVAQVLALVAWLAVLARWNQRAPLAVVLGGLFLFLGRPEGWLVTRLPADGAIHLLAALVWLLSVDRRSRVWTCLPLLAALATLEPHLALALLVASVARPPRSLPLAVLGMACGVALLGSLSSGLVAAGWLAWRHPNRLIRALALAEFLYPGSFGLAAFGIAFGRSIAVLWRRFPSERWALRLRPEFGLDVPRRFFLGAVTLLALALAALPGEEVFNDQVLIFAQKQKVKLDQLLFPRTLADWAAWRGQVVGFEASDLQAAAQLAALGEESAVYLTGQLEERVEVAALVSALAGGRPLAGWYLAADGAALLPALAAVASTGETQWLRATPARWLLRRGQPALAIEPRSAEFNGGNRGKATSLEQWGTLVWFACDGPTRLQVWRDGQPFGSEFGLATPTSARLPLQLPSLPGTYELRWPEVGSSYRVPVALPLEVSMETSSNLPSRSLLPVAVKLSNSSEVSIELGDLVGGRLALSNLSGDQKDEAPPTTPLRGLSLQPGATHEIALFLRTPPAPGTFSPRLELLDKNQKVHTFPLTAPTLLRTWDRRPPIEVPGGVVVR